jgi:hypothetical protein
MSADGAVDQTQLEELSQILEDADWSHFDDGKVKE